VVGIDKEKVTVCSFVCEIKEGSWRKFAKGTQSIPRDLCITKGVIPRGRRFSGLSEEGILSEIAIKTLDETLSNPKNWPPAEYYGQGT